MDPNPLDPENLLDLEQLEPFIDIGLEDFLEIYNDVITEVPQALEVIRDAIHSADNAAFKARCHSLRGMVANFGLKALANGIALHEKQPVMPAACQATEIHASLLALWQRSHAAITAWQKHLPAVG